MYFAFLSHCWYSPQLHFILELFARERFGFKSLSPIRLPKPLVSHWAVIIWEVELGACPQKDTGTWKENVYNVLGNTMLKSPLFWRIKNVWWFQACSVLLGRKDFILTQWFLWLMRDLLWRILKDVAYALAGKMMFSLYWSRIEKKGKWWEWWLGWSLEKKNNADRNWRWALHTSRFENSHSL